MTLHVQLFPTNVFFLLDLSEILVLRYILLMDLSLISIRMCVHQIVATLAHPSLMAPEQPKSEKEHLLEPFRLLNHFDF